MGPASRGDDHPRQPRARRFVVLAGGIGGARFLLGLRAALPDAEITVVGNTGDDITLYGLRVCPDLDTVMYTLGGGIHPGQGWGRADERFIVRDELVAYGADQHSGLSTALRGAGLSGTAPPAGWFTLGDRDLATHILRAQMLAAGHPLSEVTAALCTRWGPGVRLLPMSDDPVETHVLIDDPAGPDRRRLVHFQEYWVRLHAEPAAHEIRVLGIDDAEPAPGVLEAIATADVIIFPPSNPVVSIGTILAVPGIRQAVVESEAPVVGLSPIVGGRPVRGMADKMLTAIGVETSAAAVALQYGRKLLDGWLVDEVDKPEVPEVEAAGIACRAVPLIMRSVDASAEMARAALALAGEVRR
jgi:LPPG:FO 2-phospho-L-lactate transferase